MRTHPLFHPKRLFYRNPDFSTNWNTRGTNLKGELPLKITLSLNNREEGDKAGDKSNSIFAIHSHEVARATHNATRVF